MHTPTESFDSRLLRFGAVGILVLVIAAFISIAPRPTVVTTPGYDEAGESRWPMS
jgi:hypothetical protein